MNYFSEIPEGQAIVCNGGVYKQVPIAVRKGLIHVKHGSGYVRLHSGGGTSIPKMRWYEIDAADGDYEENGVGVKYVGPEE